MNKTQYKATDGHQDKLFTAKAAALAWAKTASSMGTAVVVQRKPGGAWDFIARFQYGRRA